MWMPVNAGQKPCLDGFVLPQAPTFESKTTLPENLSFKGAVMIGTLTLDTSAAEGQSITTGAELYHYAVDEPAAFEGRVKSVWGNSSTETGAILEKYSGSPFPQMEAWADCDFVSTTYATVAALTHKNFPVYQYSFNRSGWAGYDGWAYHGVDVIYWFGQMPGCLLSQYPEVPAVTPGTAATLVSICDFMYPNATTVDVDLSLRMMDYLGSFVRDSKPSEDWVQGTVHGLGVAKGVVATGPVEAKNLTVWQSLQANEVGSAQLRAFLNN